MNGNSRDYGSWIPAGAIRALDLITIVLITLTLAANNWFSPKVTAAVGAVMVMVLLFTLYMQAARSRMSGGPDGMMTEMSDLTLSKLPLEAEDEAGDTDDTDGGEDEPAGLRILDVGCFTGRLSVRTAERFGSARVKGVDGWQSGGSEAQCVSNASAEGFSDRVSFETADLAGLEYPDGSFDAAVSCFGFKRYKGSADKKALLEESLRVVKKGGAFAFTDSFGDQRTYGDIVGYLEALKERLDIAELHYVPKVERMDFVPVLLRAPWLLMDTGLIYGVR